MTATAGGGAVVDLAVGGVEPSFEERVRRFDEVARLVLGAAKSRPLLVVLDDLHGADEPSQLLVQHLARTAATTVCWSSFAAATLSARSPPWPRSRTPSRSSCVAWSGPPSASRSRPLPGRAASDAELAAVYDATAGNPFFVAEFARQLADGPALPGAVPRSVLDAIGQRLGQLSPDCAASLRAAALLGTRFAVPSSLR